MLRPVSSPGEVLVADASAGHPGGAQAALEFGLHAPWPADEDRHLVRPLARRGQHGLGSQPALAGGVDKMQPQARVVVRDLQEAPVKGARPRAE